MKFSIRPTQGWKLKCEQEGKTRAEAYEKTLLTIALSGSEFHIWNCGVALVVMFPVIMCACIISIFIDIEKFGIFASLGCTRLIWLITGAILMAQFADMIDTAEKNKGLTDEFDAINECADTENFVDSNALFATLENEIA